TGLSFESGFGNGTAEIRMTGTIANVNAALNGLSYLPSLNYNSSRGAETLTIVTNDQGNTGSGGAQLDTDTVSISVTPVNDAPTAQNKTGGAAYAAET